MPSIADSTLERLNGLGASPVFETGRIDKDLCGSQDHARVTADRAPIRVSGLTKAGGGKTVYLQWFFAHPLPCTYVWPQGVKSPRTL